MVTQTARVMGHVTAISTAVELDFRSSAMMMVSLLDFWMVGVTVPRSDSRSVIC